MSLDRFEVVGSRMVPGAALCHAVAYVPHLSATRQQQYWEPAYTRKLSSRAASRLLHEAGSPVQVARDAIVEHAGHLRKLPPL